ncbi:MAG: type II secretion system secretin GspD [Synergistaceae bacterium]|nr:type II secretion system secretin GspD [Synergistaceae bacterium]
MFSKTKLLSFIFILIFILSLSAGCTYAQTQENTDEEQNLVTAARQMRQSNNVQLNFSNLEISKFLRFMSELLNENIVVDPAVGGKVSVVSPKAISLREAREVMLSVLEMNNLSIQNMGGYSKVLPASSGPTLNNTVIKGDRSIAPGEALTVQVVPLRHVKAGYITEPLRSAVPDINVTPLENGNAILLTGKASALNRSVSVIRALDAQDSVRSIKAFTLTHANPKIVESQLNVMSKDTSSRLSGILAVGDERTRRVVLIGSNQALLESERILKILDVPSRAESFHVYRLKNADAKVVAEQMNSILATAAKLSPDPKGAIPSSVVPDLPTNSLVFTASHEQFGSLKEILVQLDIQPKQVLLRGLIAEVNLNKLNSAGIDWAAWGGGIAGDAVIAGNVQMGSSSVPGQIIDLYDKLITTEEIYTNPVTGNTYTTTNTEGKALIYTYVKMLNKYDAINVLSMPRLMCTDNLPSHLQVGQVIPQLKGTLTDTSNPRAVQNTYEYKDVGLILSVTPHVRSGNLVALEIEQRVEDLLTTMGSPTPVTSKREVKTNVLVANGDTIIIGGLIREAEKVLKHRVPFFSYIPLIGNLFKSSEKQREKVDLMIFLTPYILEDPKAASKMTHSIISDGQQLSPAEIGTLMKNHEGYQKSIENEGVTKDMLDPNNILSGDKQEDKKGDWKVRYNELVKEMEAKEKDKGK